jgi:uncharacterized membrane protein (DUF2068 family)
MTRQDSQEIVPPRVSPESRHSVGLRVIAIYKGFETLGLLLAAAAAFHLQRHQNVDRLVHWLEHLSLTDSNGLRWQLVEALMKLGPSRFVALGMVALGYAALHATEGIGLWLRKRWAEWFTVIATASLIPIELYETAQRISWLKLGVLLTNIVIVIYLTRVARQAYRHD